jgi:hypothetical protein
MKLAKEGQLQALTQQPVLCAASLSVSRSTTCHYEENLADMLAPTTKVEKAFIVKRSIFNLKI